MKKTIYILITVCISIVKLNAQEFQTHLDENGTLEVIDAKLEKKLLMFSEYEGLKEVKLYQNVDNTYVLEISYQPGDKLLRARKPLSMEEVSELRAKITQEITDTAPEKLLDQTGRAYLLAVTSFTGLVHHGWSLPEALNVEGGKPFIGTFMLTSGASFIAPYYLTKNKEVSFGTANLAVYGNTRGIIHGRLLANTIMKAPEYPEYYYYNDNDWLQYEEEMQKKSRFSCGMGVLFSATETFGGYLLASKTDMTVGRTATISAMGDFGFGMGACIGHLADFSSQIDERPFYGSILTTSILGMAAGNFMDYNNIYTMGDAFMLRGAGALGAYIPLSFAIAADANDEKAYTGSLLVGGLAGMATGQYMAKRWDFTTSQGIMICLAESAGALTGAGIGYLIGNENEAYKTVSIFSAFGAIAGFVGTSSYFIKHQQKEEAKNYSLDFNLNPMGFTYLQKGNSFASSNSTIQNTMFSARLSF